MAWESRIVGHGDAAPADLVGNPRNWRTHPQAQRDALAGVLDEVGWVQDVIVNKRTGYLVDGHARVAVAAQRGETSVPVVYVDLSEDEERLILASLDPLSAMAEADDDALADLLAAVTAEDGALAEMLEALDAHVGEVDFPALPDGDRSPIRQMTFTVTEDQQAIIEGALSVAKSDGAHKPEATGNENSNGNALAFVCAGYEAA